MVKNWKFRGGGGGLREIPSVVGVWIFSGTTQYNSKLHNYYLMILNIYFEGLIMHDMVWMARLANLLLLNINKSHHALHEQKVKSI